MTRPAQIPYLKDSLPGRRGWPLAFAHRGADTARENTLGAFRHAVERGYGYLELDVRTSADGVLVVFHDETLDRVTTGTGRLSAHTWAELARLRVVDPDAGPACSRGPGKSHGPAPSQGQDGPDDQGEPLLRFEELVAAWPDVRLNVDLKDDAAAEAIVPIIARHDAWDRVLIASFHDSRRRLFTRAAGRRLAMSGGWLAIAALVAAAPVGLSRLVARRLAHVDCVQVPVRQGPITVVTPRFVARFQAAGLQVHVWVVDEPAEMERLLALGVDGLMTDDAEALASVMEVRGHWPQR